MYKTNFILQLSLAHQKLHFFTCFTILLNSCKYLRHNYFNEFVKDLFSDHNDCQLHQELK